MCTICQGSLYGDSRDYYCECSAAFHRVCIVKEHAGFCSVCKRALNLIKSSAEENENVPLTAPFTEVGPEKAKSAPNLPAVCQGESDDCPPTETINEFPVPPSEELKDVEKIPPPPPVKVFDPASVLEKVQCKYCEKGKESVMKYLCEHKPQCPSCIKEKLSTLLDKLPSKPNCKKCKKNKKPLRPGYVRYALTLTENSEHKQILESWVQKNVIKYK